MMIKIESMQRSLYKVIKKHNINKYCKAFDCIMENQKVN